MTPLVSVCCITYNHEPYIRQCLEGFLIQKTNFPIEILIFDDASTDNNQSIIKDFASKDNRIVTYLQTENQWSKQKYGLIEWLFPAARGKYIALCEGDDYWTDPLKLQKQVDFLEANEDCSLCFHPVKMIFVNNMKRSFVKRPKKIPRDNKFEIKDAILGGGGFIPTNSMFFKKSFLEKIPEWMTNAPVGDLPLMLLLSSNGKIGYVKDLMSVHRVFVKGSWTSSVYNDKLKRKVNYTRYLKMWDEFDLWTDRNQHLFIVMAKIKVKLRYFKSYINFLNRIKKDIN